MPIKPADLITYARSFGPEYPPTRSVRELVAEAPPSLWDAPWPGGRAAIYDMITDGSGFSDSSPLGVAWTSHFGRNYKSGSSPGFAIPDKDDPTSYANRSKNPTGDGAAPSQLKNPIVIALGVFLAIRMVRK